MKKIRNFLWFIRLLHIDINYILKYYNTYIAMNENIIHFLSLLTICFRPKLILMDMLRSNS